jgi:hypothetical protein
MTLQSPPPLSCCSEMGVYHRKACTLLELQDVFSLLRIVNKPRLIVYMKQQKTRSD